VDEILANEGFPVVKQAQVKGEQIIDQLFAGFGFYFQKRSSEWSRLIDILRSDLDDDAPAEVKAKADDTFARFDASSCFTLSIVADNSLILQ